MKAKTNPTKSTPNIQSVELKVYNRPSFTDTVFNGKRWIPRGKDNLFAIYLIDLYNQSNTHGAVVDGKISYMVGRGLYVETENQNLYDVAECQQFLEHPNPYETWDAIDKKIKTDFEIHNAFAFEILRNKFGNPVEVYHLSWDRLALDKTDTNLYLYSEDWETKYSTPEKRQQNQSPLIVEIPKFDPKQIQPRSVIVHTEPHPGMRFYPLPSYINGIEAIEEEIEISQFHLNNVMNGFVGGTMINFLNGIPDDTIQEQIENKMTTKFTGGRGSKLLLNFSDGKESAAEVHPLTPNTLDKQFEQRAKVVPENIIIAHRGVSGMLFGIKTEGQLGGRTEILESYELFKETYIKPRQDTVLAVYNSIFKLFGCKPLIKTKELKPLANLLPLTEQTIASVIPREVIKDYLVELYGLTLPKPVAPISMYDENQPREENGQWGDGGGGSSAASAPKSVVNDSEYSIPTYSNPNYAGEGKTNEEKTIHSFTRNGYKVNELIREDKLWGMDAKYAENLEKSLNQLPDHKGEVHRVIRDSGGKNLKEFMNNKGGVVEWKGFTSTSQDKSAIDRFANVEDIGEKVIFKIKSKTGKNVAHLSDVPEEKEIVFNRGTKFKIISVTKNVVSLEEL